MINARAETVEEKKTFAKAFRNLRCLFPMSGFYEWDSNKQKFLFKVGEKQTLYIAEFYRIHKTDAGLKTESIIMTTKPNSSVSSVHDRMPLIVDRSHIEDWLNNLDFARTYLSADMPELKKMITEK